MKDQTQVIHSSQGKYDFCQFDVIKSPMTCQLLTTNVYVKYVSLILFFSCVWFLQTCNIDDDKMGAFFVNATTSVRYGLWVCPSVCLSTCPWVYEYDEIKNTSYFFCGFTLWHGIIFIRTGRKWNNNEQERFSFVHVSHDHAWRISKQTNTYPNTLKIPD